MTDDPARSGRPAGPDSEAAATYLDGFRCNAPLTLVGAEAARKAHPTGAAILEDVFVPWERVFLAGEWQHSGLLTTNYATHHRHSCIGARAGSPRNGTLRPP